MLPNVFNFLRFSASKSFYFALFFYETSMATIIPNVDNCGHFIKGRGILWFIGDKECLILILRSMKLYNPMEHPIKSQKMTMTVFRSFFCKCNFKRPIDLKLVKVIFRLYFPKDIFKVFIYNKSERMFKS